tara:strand:+ start:759 stop:1505 length:747 start_codon:yes stop_codon:yes gene_type:complete
MEKKVTTFKEFTYSRPETTKFPKSIMKKGSDSLQRYKKLGGDSNLKKAMADAEKIVPIRQTPKQLRQFLTILKKKYKEYGGKDKDLLNSFTEKLEQKILESLEESVLTETRNPFKYDHSIYARDKDTAPRKPSWTRLPVADMLIRNGGMSPKELLDLFVNKMNQSNKSDKGSLEYVVKKGNKSSMLINSFKESIEEQYKPEVKKAESELIKRIQAYTYLPISTNENAIDKSLKQLKDVIKKLKGKTRT